MQGTGAHEPHTLTLAGGAATLAFDEGAPPRPDAFTGLFESEPVAIETGVTVARMEPYDLLQLYVAATAHRIAELTFHQDGAGHGLPVPQIGFTAVVDDDGSLAYLTLHQAGEGEATRFEFVAVGLGPRAADVARGLAAVVLRWHEELRGGPNPDILIAPTETPTEGPGLAYTLIKRHTRISLDFRESVTHRASSESAALT